MNMMIYRRLEKELQLYDYDCVSFFWRKMFTPNTAGGRG
jgi:hypothetical protein